MKDDAIRSREVKISERISEIKDLRKQQSTYRHHVQSPYFKSALLGEHPYVDLSKDRDSYLARHATFAGKVEDKISSLIEESARLPRVENQLWDRKRDLRIGIISDRFLYASLQEAAEFVNLTPSGYARQMSEIDLLLITSAWRGLNGEWHNLPLPASDAYRVLSTGVVPLARQLDIPIAFYSKEDPPNFEKFATVARLADYVFTTASECVPKYKKLLGSDVPVEVLPFSVNFRSHNPLGSMRHSGHEYVFAGSWFDHKYADRRTAAQSIFDGVLEAGADLTIVDRNLGLDAERFSNVDKYLYPERYLPYIHGPMDHEVLMNLQRLLPVGINLNSVVGSQSMFANRVIELQAMGTRIISNYNAGVNSQFPHVGTPDSRGDVRRLIEGDDTATVRAAQVEGIRSAYSTNTSFDRIDQIVNAVGLSSSKSKHRILVSGLSASAYNSLVATQTFPGEFVRLEAASGDVASGSRDGDVSIDFNDDRVFGPNLVQDVVNAYRYTDSESIVVETIDCAEDLYERSTVVGRPRGSISATWVPAQTSVTDASRTVRSSVAIASDIPAVRREVINAGQPSARLTVVVPVYNNGVHLKHKCFDSLKRSAVFSDAEIMLVDDGSTDPVTKAIVSELEELYANVRVYRFPEGGSGSASRPRNKGLDLTRTPFVTYLDPDNEQTNDGFAELLKTIEGSDFNFAIGNMVRFKDKRTMIRNSSVLKAVVDPDGYLGQGALERIRFQPMSIQALVARTDWLKSLRLTQPVGAVGQDSYFFQQMLFYATRISVTPLPIHTYYAAVSNSTVNNLGPRFYEKYIPLERDRSQWLREVGLLDAYNSTRLEPFAKGWFMQKLSLVPVEELERCRSLIRELISFYGKDDFETPEIRALFEETSNV